MADNITIPTTGTGTATPVVATDDVGGVHFQKVKLDGGGDGASAAIGGDATNGLDVDVTRVQGNVDVEGLAAVGAAPSGNPVLMGVSDGTNVQLLHTTSDSAIQSPAQVGVIAVGVGPGFDLESGSASNLGTAVNSAVTWDPRGGATLAVYIVTGTTGTVIFEATQDGTNWFTHPTVVLSGTIDTFVLGAITPATGQNFRINSSGFRSIRIRTATTLGAAVSVYSVISQESSIVKGSDMAPPPHNMGYLITSKTAQYTTTQTGTALWTPASGRRLAIMNVQIQVGGTTAGTMQLWFGASGDTTYTRGTDLAIFDGEFAPSATNKPGVIMSAQMPYISSAADHVLRVTDSAAINPLTVTVWGYEF